MRKISAHFCLMPDGTLGKWPVVSIDPDGVITELRVNSDHLNEEPGMEYYGGVIVPGFIEDIRNCIFPDHTESEMMKLIDNFYSRGSIRFLCRSDQKYFNTTFKGKVFYDNSFIAEVRKPCEKKSFWEKVKEGKGINIIDTIYLLQKKLTDYLPESVSWGRMKVDSAPGILLVKGLDYAGMELTDRTSIKILIH